MPQKNKRKFIKRLMNFRDKLKQVIQNILSINLTKNNLDKQLKPNIDEYTAMGHEWKPYLMRGTIQNAKSNVLSTDETGSRVSCFQGVPIFYQDYRQSQGNYSVLLGNSVAYGVGASNDMSCLASQLSRLTNHPWYNLSGRAYNQTQEVLSLLLLGADQHQNIVVFSGINNLIFSLAFEEFDQSLMPFWGQDKLLELNPSFKHLTPDKNREFFNQESTEIKYKKMMFFLDRDLRILSSFAKYKIPVTDVKNNLIYIFQPLLAWTDKQLHPSEKEAIIIWDKETTSVFKLAHQPANILPWKERYLAELKTLCLKYEINFFDMNSDTVFKQAEHLFLDRVHLTDLGQLRAAECIQNYLQSC